jgi:hypothetical protein
MQFTITYSSDDFTGVSVAPEGDITAPHKALSCTPGKGTVRCLVWGPNDAPLGAGHGLASITMQVSRTAHSKSTVYVTKPLGVAPSNTAVALASSSAEMTLK